MEGMGRCIRFDKVDSCQKPIENQTDLSLTLRLMPPADKHVTRLQAIIAI